MVKNGSVTKVMVIFLAITLVSSSFTAFSVPALASGPGSFIDAFVSAGSGGLNIPKNLIFGPDGNLYVISYAQDKVKRYDGTTGAFIDTFVASGSGGLDNPQGLEFGPDDNLYVTSQNTHEVLRYDGTSGAFIDVFVSGGLSFPQESIFGPDGNLYVSNYFTDTVVRFNGTSGAFIDIFVSAGSGGLDMAQGLEFGPDGNLYVASQNTDQVLRYNGTTGSFIDAFVNSMLHDAKDLTFGPDGNLYGTDNQHSHVERYDGTTGAKIDRYVSGGTGGISSPQGLVFGPDGNLYVTSQNTDEILRYEGPLIVNSDPIAQDDEIDDETEEESGLIEFSIQAVNGTANVQITKDGEITELEIDFNNAIQVLNEIKLIVGLDVNDIYSEWAFEAINEEENIKISIVAKDGVANVKIVQDGETTEFEVGTTKRNEIRNEIQSVTGIDLNTIDFDWTLEMKIYLFEKKVTLCHIPGGNPLNSHILSVSKNSIKAHLGHGDYLGTCTDDDDELEERELLKKIKKQREETRAKNDLKEKRHALKEIKKDLNDLKKLLNDEEKLRIKTLVNEIKDVIKKLNEDHDYEKEHKKIIKQELKEIKLKIKQEMTHKEKAFKHKIDAKVHSLAKSDNPQRDAKKLGFDFKDGKTKIVIKLSDDNSEIVDYLSSLGTVDVKNDKHVQLTIKVSDLPKLNSINGIDKIRPPFSAIQFYEELSEGVYFINADLAQFAGITGEGVKAAVLDLAFNDNEKISDNVVQVKSFRQGIGFLPIQGNEGEAAHGTAVAEIITDVAPDIELYLYSMETDIEFTAAVDEAISQKVDIIAMSAGWPNFPTDGASHITKKIEEAVDNGIVFVVPAGNFANKHWEGIFADSNFNNWHEYSDSDEGLSFTITEERIAEEKPIISHLMWDVGNGDVADFELVLVDPLGQIVDFSANEQLTKSDTPFEYIHHIPEIEGTYSLGVLYAGDMSKVSLRPSATLEIFSINDELEHPVSHSSVSVPADADGAIVVGAINHLDGLLEPFSSQGPTNNGKLAPHVVGPDGVTTLALDGEPFYGTSATTPYVAGLAALILQTNPDISPKELLTMIQENTDSSLFSSQTEYDYSSGYGTANAFFLIEDQEVLG